MKKFKKLTVIAHRDDLRDIVFSLMRLRCVALREISAEYAGMYRTEPLDAMAVSAARAEIEKIYAAVAALSGETKKSRAPKIKADPDNFLAEKIDEKARFAVEQTLAARERKREIAVQIEETAALAAMVEPFFEYALPLGLKKTQRTSVIFGIFPPRTELSAVGKKLYEAGAVADNFKTDRTGVYVSVFCHLADTEKVREVLDGYGFAAADFEEGIGTAPIVHGEYMRKTAALKEEAARLSDREKAAAAALGAIRVLYDIEKSRLNYLLYSEKIGKSSESALFEGCFPASDEDAVSTALGYFDCAFSIEDADKSESPLYIKKLAGADDEKSLEKISMLREKNKDIFLPMVMSDTYSDLNAAI